MKKYLKYIIAPILVMILCVQTVLPSFAWDKEMISCTVLGDSIAKGYSASKKNPIKSYGRLVTERLAEEEGTYYNYSNYAVNGLDTEGLNKDVLSRDTVKRYLNKSDIILVTIGSNDLLNECKNMVTDILNMDTKFRSAPQAIAALKTAIEKNPLIILKLIDALSKWNYGRFEKQWAQAMKTIQEQKKESAQIIVTNIYNPVHKVEMPGTINKVLEDIIQNMNGIIEKRADEYGYKIVDLFDSDVTAFVQKDGLHPNSDGQQLIADLVYEKLEDPDEKSELQEDIGKAQNSVTFATHKFHKNLIP